MEVQKGESVGVEEGGESGAGLVNYMFQVGVGCVEKGEVSCGRRDGEF